MSASQSKNRTNQEEEDIPPISPLLEPSYQYPSRDNQIREFDYGLRKHRTKFRLLVVFLTLWPLLCWTGIFLLFSDHPALFPSSLRGSKSTLFVVAHPDDECLFFAPSILATVQRAKSHGALLVMSSGNHYGQGGLRRKELLGSCKQLGIREDRCDVLDISICLPKKFAFVHHTDVDLDPKEVQSFSWESSSSNKASKVILQTSQIPIRCHPIAPILNGDCYKWSLVESKWKHTSHSCLDCFTIAGQSSINHKKLLDKSHVPP
ncbi:N-acetylglucosaminylphosphatidylinositol deacetylase [Puccinia graminis f. sp. tritici CRL 75-36-700-3]|uniref:N-acetylglucosaminylphosphatidylinositol deacetylase n=1 Tax=Puccinia graminis f. sp. tritici (strain CRL 75-36-700-3 / race SCCL) TaxID=418459 RepID=E3LA25_PUCGT|nr:N-acetylglucosaminylphosphatidylinositol deacetylase [Puccinia graminis f. sp. tritici CRL 75-36-700-3]EFP93400.2 N-acetylglucosaminylphosphatidylinositol deacetylase [Puccinia graminis f. sp. tritici CRL 75-36-700-3]